MNSTALQLMTVVHSRQQIGLECIAHIPVQAVVHASLVIHHLQHGAHHMGEEIFGQGLNFTKPFLDQVAETPPHGLMAKRFHCQTAELQDVVLCHEEDAQNADCNVSILITISKKQKFTFCCPPAFVAAVKKQNPSSRRM